MLTAYAEPKERGSFDPNGHSTKNTRRISWYFEQDQVWNTAVFPLTTYYHALIMDNWHSINQFFPKRQLRLGCKFYESHISFDPETYPFGNHDCFILGYGLLHLLLKTIVEPLQVNKKYRKNTHISNPSMFYMSSSHSHGKISHRSPNIVQFFEVIPFDGHQIHLNLPRWALGHLCSQHSDCDLPYWLNKTGVNIIPQLLGI